MPVAANGGQWDAWLHGSLDQLQKRTLMRKLRPVEPTTSPVEVLIAEKVLSDWLSECPGFSVDQHSDGNVPPHTQTAQLEAAETAAPARRPGMHRLRLFSLNDYLGLSTHPDVRQAAAEAALTQGMGPRSSALVGGYTEQHRELEAALADLKGAEACLLFPTGFAANLGTIAALCGNAHTAIFSDELNHASIVDGCRLAVRQGATLQVYRHNDMKHLHQLLSSCPPGRRKLVVADSLFSMDGDYADLPGLATLRARHGFALMLDEAHATLVTGPNGAGWAEQQRLGAHVDVSVGTFSKAFGCHGGFVAGSAALITFLTNRGRPYVFSTALPAPVAAAALAALRVSQQETWRRAHLRRLWLRLGSALGVEARSPIVPLVVGSEAAAVAASARLLARGLHVPAIRPPTVPPGTSRLRISLSAAHSEADVDLLIRELRACGLPTASSPAQPSTAGSNLHLDPQPHDSAADTERRPGSHSIRIQARL